MSASPTLKLDRAETSAEYSKKLCVLRAKRIAGPHVKGRAAKRHSGHNPKKHGSTAS